MHSKLKRLPRESLENMDYYEQIKFNGIYLPAREERFQKWISPNGTYQIFVPLALALFGLGNRKRVVDVGANVGLISRVFSLLYEEVIAFEPSPQNRACLSRNLSPEHNNVVIYPYALGSEEKSSWIDETLNNCGGDELIESDMITSNNVPGYKPVFIKTLDEILKGDEISALKIDVQGGDFDVLKGGVSTIQRNKPLILVETGGSDYNNTSRIDKLEESPFDVGPYHGRTGVAGGEFHLGPLSDEERQIITVLVEDRFLDDPALSEVLLSTAEAKARQSVELYSVTKIISQTFSYEERMDILQSIWEVVLSDGRVDDFEDQLMRRLGGLIHISDRDRAFTRQRAEKVLALD